MSAEVTSERRQGQEAVDANVCVNRAPYDGMTAPETRAGIGEGKEEMTAMQKHCAWFDRDGDGYVSPMDTYKSSRALGFNPLTSSVIAFFINVALAPASADGWYPTVYVNLKNVHRCKHGSDTGVYDETGRFVPAHFDALFDRYDTDRQAFSCERSRRDGKLSWKEFFHRARAQRATFDLYGQAATLLEFGFTYWLAAEEGGKLSRETLKGCYDGSLFERIEAEVKAKREANKGWWYRWLKTSPKHD
ncbi:Caleosin related protein-domain-containing protein [Tribonema minus]|uniref:Caleosin related protein-domain-containing protein n=1 Tax=Tribonema minus TaxID=303371 RepID=A0A835Z2I0_9STRA|nr:Caleosin related protein-domain-containing protein [Tribonema minus]